MPAICPVPDCSEHPINGCEFCSAHQRLVNLMRLWLDGIVNDTGSTFDADRCALDAPPRRRV